MGGAPSSRETPGRLGGPNSSSVDARSRSVFRAGPQLAPGNRAWFERGVVLLAVGTMYRQDLIQRQIELLGQALARVLGHQNAGETHQARQELRDAYRLLGIDASMLCLDTTSIVSLLGAKEKVDGIRRILRAEAELERLLGNQAVARRLEDRANEFDGLVTSNESSE